MLQEHPFTTETHSETFSRPTDAVRVCACRCMGSITALCIGSEDTDCIYCCIIQSAEKLSPAKTYSIPWSSVDKNVMHWMHLHFFLKCSKHEYIFVQMLHDHTGGLGAGNVEMLLATG